MFKTTALDSVGNQYVDKDVGGGTPGTRLEADDRNIIQDELVNAIEGTGGVLDPTGVDRSQLLTAILTVSEIPIGTQMSFPNANPPINWLVRDGSSISMTTFEGLYDVINSIFGLGAGVVCTFTAASDLVNKVAHGLSDDDVLELTNSGGGLPAGLAADTKYFVVNAAADTFQLSENKGGVAIDFTTDGTGTNSFHDEFLLADDRGLFERFVDNGAGIDPDAASRTDRGDGTTGDNVGTMQADQFKAHTHPENVIGILSAAAGATELANQQAGVTGFTGGNQTNPINRAYLPCIRF